ncbi:MAG: spore protease YyaC [Peptococcaceae bacterium]|nr:spore protease YyaC [Peptococcaceae bacterium]
MTAVNVIIKDQAYPAKTKIHREDPLAVAKLSWDLAARLRRAGVERNQDKVLLCIGTDRSTGDCLGPLVGSKMQAVNQDFLHVYGTLDDPVHAGNLKEKLDEIYSRFRNPYIIAVDACLGSLENVGHISIGDGSLQPGAGVNKNLPAVGDIHITGIVNVGGFLEYMVLQNTRLNVVMKMADLIMGGLCRMISEICLQGAVH